MDYDILIIGAGPIGSTLAYKLKSFGLSVMIADKKKIIGKQACSGLFSNRITKYFDIDDDMIENTIDGAIFHTKDCIFEIIKGKSTALVIDRERFDQFVFKRAIDNEVNATLASEFSSCTRTEHGYKTHIETKDGLKTITSRLIIGADGAASHVRRHFKLNGNLKYVNGILSYYPIKDRSRMVELYYSPTVAPGFFAWKIPRGNRQEFGLATDRRHNHLSYFKRFLKTQGKEQTQYFAHPICFGNQDCVTDNMILIGDAAAQVKPFSGGGIIYSLICTDIAAKAISASFDKSDHSKEFLKKHYEDVWKKRLMPKIDTGLAIRNILDSLNDRELSTFFRILKEQKSAIESFGDMDFL